MTFFGFKTSPSRRRLYKPLHSKGFIMVIPAVLPRHITGISFIYMDLYQDLLLCSLHCQSPRNEVLTY